MLLAKIVGLAMFRRAMCEAANVETQPGFTVSVCKEGSCTKRHGASSSEVRLRSWDPPKSSPTNRGIVGNAETQV